MRSFCLFSGCGLGFLACQGPASAQTMVEYGAASSASATAASASKGVGNSVGGVLDSLGKALNQSQDQVRKVEPATNGRPATTKSAKPKRDAIKEAATAAVPPPSYEDAMGIRKGMSCEEVTRRFGPPAMSFAGEDDAKTMSYAGKTGRVQVECQGGKVAAAEKSY